MMRMTSIYCVPGAPFCLDSLNVCMCLDYQLVVYVVVREDWCSHLMSSCRMPIFSNTSSLAIQVQRFYNTLYIIINVLKSG